MDTSSTTKISVVFQFAFANRFLDIFAIICSIVPLPNPILAQECRVFALQSNKIAAQPVNAQTLILNPFLTAS